MKNFKDPCWKDYEMVGNKVKNGKTVPNCVPVKEEVVKKTPTEVNSPHNAMAFDGPYTKAGDVKDKSGAVHKAMSRARDLARKSLAQHKKVKENGHVKEEVDQLGEDVLDKFIMAKGIDPNKLSRDKKLVHAKSSEFSKWKSERQVSESFKAQIVKEAWKKAKSKLTETDSGADDEAVQAPKKKKSNGKDAFNKDPVLSSAITKPTESA